MSALACASLHVGGAKTSHNFIKRASICHLGAQWTAHLHFRAPGHLCALLVADNDPLTLLELRLVAGCKLPPKCQNASSMCRFVRLPPNMHWLPEQHSSRNFLPHPLLRGGCGPWQHNSHAPKHLNPMEVDFCSIFVLFPKKCSKKEKVLV